MIKLGGLISMGAYECGGPVAAVLAACDRNAVGSGSVTPGKVRGSGGLTVIGAIVLISAVTSGLVGEVLRRDNDATWRLLVLAAGVMAAAGLLCVFAALVLLIVGWSRGRTDLSDAELEWGLDSAEDWLSPVRSGWRQPGPERDRPEQDRPVQELPVPAPTAQAPPGQAPPGQAPPRQGFPERAGQAYPSPERQPRPAGANGQVSGPGVRAGEQPRPAGLNGQASRPADPAAEQPRPAGPPPDRQRASQPPAAGRPSVRFPDGREHPPNGQAVAPGHAASPPPGHPAAPPGQPHSAARQRSWFEPSTRPGSASQPPIPGDAAAAESRQPEATPVPAPPDRPPSAWTGQDALDDTCPLPVILPGRTDPPSAAQPEPAQHKPEGGRPMQDEAKLGQLKDLYLTAGVIGDEALARHFDGRDR